jgi:small multidrug resistance pump
VKTASILNVAIIALGIAANATASVLIKVAGEKRTGATASSESIWGSPTIAMSSGLFFYGITFVMYALALQRLPLHIAHPVMTAGAVAVVALASSLLFNARMPGPTILGIGLIVIGVVLIGSSSD